MRPREPIDISYNAFMRAWPRPLRIACCTMLGGIVGITLLTSLWLMVWVPTQGKAWLEAQLQRQTPLQITIGSLQYAFWNGLRLEDLRGVDPTTQTTWIHASHVNIQVNLLHLALRRPVAFHLKAAVLAPCDTTAAISGRYDIRARHLIADLLTSEIPVTTLLPQFAQRFPALKAGRERLRLHVSWQQGGEPVMTGQLIGTHLVWQDGAVGLTGNLVIEGTVIPSPHEATPWFLDLTMRLDKGRGEGLPVLTQAEEISGTAHLTNTGVQITMLSGKTLGSPWQLEGVVESLTHPRVDVRLRSHVEIANIAAQLIEPLPSWQPDGTAELVVVCRGPLAPWSPHLSSARRADTSHDAVDPPSADRQVGEWPAIEIMAHAQLHDVSLSVPKVSQRIEHLTGYLEYDHLTKRLLLGSLQGRMQHDPLTLEGSIDLTTPPLMHLTIHTATELGLLQALLPQGSPIESLAGRAEGELVLEGDLAHPHWQGEATLNDVRVRLSGLPKPVEGLSGLLRFTNEELSSPRLSFTIDDELVSASGTLTNLTTSPHLTCHAQLTNGSASLNATVRPDRFVLETGELTIDRSHLLVQGHISRLPDQASRLTAAGTIELDNLSHMPWIHLKAVDAWHLSGETNVQLRLLGSLADWRGLEAEGFLRAEQMVIGGMSLRMVNAELEQNHGRMAVRLTHAIIADGRVSGEMLMQHNVEPARYFFTCDLTRADLAQLAASIPDWSRRPIRGNASIHAILSGVGNDRSSLHGEGWVHATGEELGELPLLDRLFHGVFGALADRLGLASVRKARLTKLTGQWRLSQARFSTDDLRLTGSTGLEPIVVVFRGSVGLDHTLDLIVEPALPEQLIVQASATSALGTTISTVIGRAERLRRLVGWHHLGGTIEKPEYAFKFSLDQLLNQLLSSGLGPLFESAR